MNNVSRTLGSPAFAIAAPGCLLALASLIVPAMAAFGHNPVWPHEAYNLAEAAAVREEAEVVRLIEQGHDPNIRYPIRPSFGFNRPTSLTPLEAAVLRDDPAMVRQLFAKGVRMDAALWTTLRCAARSTDMSSLLDRYRPDSASIGCDASTASADAGDADEAEAADRR